MLQVTSIAVNIVTTLRNLSHSVLVLSPHIQTIIPLGPINNCNRKQYDPTHLSVCLLPPFATLRGNTVPSGADPTETSCQEEVTDVSGSVATKAIDYQQTY